MENKCDILEYKAWEKSKRNKVKLGSGNSRASLEMTGVYQGMVKFLRVIR